MLTFVKQPIGAHEPTRPYEDAVEMPDPASPRLERPVAIAHFAPR